jgi:subfamily B ATP-binding cassette protein MsbA
MNDAATTRPTDLALYRRLLGHVLPYRGRFLLALAAMLALALTAPLVAALLQPMLDDVLLRRDRDMMVRLPFYVIALFTFRAAASWASVVALQSVANRVVLDLRAAMFRALLALPSAFHDRHAPGGLVSRFTYDVTQVRSAATEALTVLCRDSLYIAGLLAWMAWLDWRMTLISVLSAPFIMVVVKTVRGRLRRMNRKVQESMADIHETLGEVLDGQRIVKLFGAQPQETDRFGRIIEANRRYSMKAVAAAAAGAPAAEVVTALALAALIWYAGREALAGSLSVGGFVSFFAAVAMLLPPLKRLVRINEHIQRGLAACESVFGLIDEQREPETGGIVLPRGPGAIDIRDLEFGYAGQSVPALRGVSLSIRPGETVALVGASGSGKTTLAHLLPRFYDTAGAGIYIDGHDIRRLTLASLRANIALVSQDLVLFNDTVRNNIAWGARRGAAETEIVAAAEAANALEFIRALPGGFDTVIGARGTQLSGGQRQRLALARALLKDAPILILDEATSALDPESERAIQAALERLRHRHTCILIAHRASTIAAADRIVVLEHGRVVESGSEQDLLAAGGVYARMQRSAPPPPG